MFSYFSDLQVELLARGVLEPGEQLTGKTVTRYMPWWAFGLINRTYLILTTDRRVVLLDHRLAWLHSVHALRAVESIPWSNVQELALKGLFSKKVRFRGQALSGPIHLTMKVPNALFGLLAPMRGNMEGARAVAASFASQRQLLGQQTGPASMPFGPQQHMLSAPPPPSSSYYPPQNAPGYTSVPPASGPQSQQQQQQQYGAPMPPPLPPGRFPQV